MSSRISANNHLPPPPPPKPVKTSSTNIDTTKYQNNVATNNDYLNTNGSNDIANNSIANQNGNGLRNCHTPPHIEREQVVMTPKSKTARTTIILIERKLVNHVHDRLHVAGGDHTGIIINKEQLKDQKSSRFAPHLALEFRVFLVNSNTGKHTQESRTLRFWFRQYIKDDDQQAQLAQDFFRELVSPKEFPRDYVGFIKKIMKLMQKGYDEIKCLEVELQILDESEQPPTRPPRDGYIIYCYGDCNRRYEEALRAQKKAASMEESQYEAKPLTQEYILELIEQAYPNPIRPDDLAKDFGWDEQEILRIIISLKERGLIKAMEFNSYTRIHHEDHDIKVVKQMPTIASNKQPTIAIITAQYCEKVAVDAMLENKETFVRYTTVGESNVYTLGNIGAHRIVSTKLPSIGGSREAMTAAGNTTTRLLGTFQKVDYVFIVGVAGGIPHFTDYRRHVRLGDVVVSSYDKNRPIMNGNNNSSSGNKPYIYVYSSENNVKNFYPVNDCLQKIANNLQVAATDDKKPWETYFNEGLHQLRLKTETDFSRPAANTDKLYMNIGNREVIEVQHPQPEYLNEDEISNNDISNNQSSTRIHLGPIGSGKDLIKTDNLRTEFAKKYGLLATDVEMSSVLESIIGNCRDSFILVKGVSDYKDGLSTRKWQNYSSLIAAAVMKSIICGMDAPTNV
ncbi:uncharacterized protein LOC129605192 isoform X2 [Condylostylus longicornis]|uniref:uncharacterized protein LOC129605192 isoform X2 n=1 Tax=Condylostylus longicornis TaxID=2530218 RepID=UPI00244E2B33|nr:uncharacterized protein LOC129605192 isoform X2 [Condylostylus longicornis]